jgi:hypothetical protein
LRDCDVGVGHMDYGHEDENKNNKILEVLGIID